MKATVGIFVIVLVLSGCSKDSNTSLTNAAVNLKRFESCQQMQEATEMGRYAVQGEAVLAASGAQDNSSSATPSTPVLGETNIQVEGVDELDVVKADGDLIYRVVNDSYYAWDASDSTARIQVLRRTPTSSAAILADQSIDGYARGIFLLANELIVLAEHLSYPKSEIEIAYYDRLSNGEITLKSQRRIDGSLRTARLIDGYLHLVLVNQMQEKAPDMLPTTTVDQKAESLRQCEDVLHEPGLFDDYEQIPFVHSIMCVMSIDTASADKKPQGECVAAALASQIYASTEHIYLASSGWGEETPIHRFALANKKQVTKYLGSGLVNGFLINSFAMDEFAGHLRVATTIGFNGSNEVAVLKLVDQGLKTVGKIENIAAGESIYAVRFVGKVGYVVTFKKVDPLFSIDLSNPNEPEVRGELKIPGFSTYLHPISEDHLVAIGKHTEEALEGEFAWFQGVALSIFDVSDIDDPQLVQKLTIGGRGTDSEALEDHKAFRYDAQNQLVVIPIDLYSQSSGQSSWGDYQYSAFQIYKATVEEGFSLVGESIFPDHQPVYWSYPQTSNSRSFVKDGVISLVGGGRLVLRDASQPDTDLAVLDLGE